MATRWEDRDRGDYRDEGRYQDRDRGVVSRTRDEVASWFGNDEAARRRRMDDMRDERAGSGWADRFGSSMERGWDRARDSRGDYGASERWRDPRSSGYRDPDYWHSERSFGDTSRYATVDPYATPGWNRPAYQGRERQEPSYYGRGPRGYQRGDERIREDICERLTEDPRIDASDIDVQVANAEVTLTGSVRTRDEKHFTENVVERIIGVREVNNNLKVRPPDEVLGTARSGASTLGLTETPPPEPRSTSRSR